METKIFLDRNRKKRIEQGHPWVYQSEVARSEGTVEPGSIVEIVNHQGVFLARGYANPMSQIIARVLSYNPAESIDEAFFRRRIQTAWAYRCRHLDNVSSCRVVYGEADFLPGLIVDKYGDYLVVQMLSFGMEAQKQPLLTALLDVLQPKGIYLRNDVPVRRLEGLTEEKGLWYGEVPREIQIEENGLKAWVDVVEGQKTGHFLDQRENRTALKPLLQGWPTDANGDGKRGATMLECFCHTGLFTIHALHYGAQQVTAVDISEPAIEMAQRNIALNFSPEVAKRATLITANAFDFLREAELRKDLYDIVLLDPPAFAKSKRALPGAVRGYKEINLRGLKLLREGGYLITASCSYHLSPELFRDTVLQAAVDAHKVLRLVHWASAGKDHPELAGVAEGHYLKFAIYEVRSRG